MVIMKITIYVDDDDDPSHYEWVVNWIEKWKNLVIVADYSTGGWEHCWDLEAPVEAIKEVPEEYLCESRWTRGG